MKHGSLILAFAAIILSCQPATTPVAGPVTINGSWKLATWTNGGATYQAASGVVNGSLTIPGDGTFTRTTDLAGTLGSDSGTVVLKSGSTYTLVSASGNTDYDLSADGTTLTSENTTNGINMFLGAKHTYKK